MEGAGVSFLGLRPSTVTMGKRQHKITFNNANFNMVCSAPIQLDLSFQPVYLLALLTDVLLVPAVALNFNFFIQFTE